MEALVACLVPASSGSTPKAASIPNFASFDSTAELWKDYRAKLYTVVSTNSIPERKMAHWRGADTRQSVSPPPPPPRAGFSDCCLATNKMDRI